MFVSQQVYMYEYEYIPPHIPESCTNIFARAINRFHRFECHLWGDICMITHSLRRICNSIPSINSSNATISTFAKKRKTCSQRNIQWSQHHQHPHYRHSGGDMIMSSAISRWSNCWSIASSPAHPICSDSTSSVNRVIKPSPFRTRA